MQLEYEIQTDKGFQLKTVTVPVETDFEIDQDDLEQSAVDMARQVVTYGDLFATLKAQLLRHEEMLKRTYAGVATAIRDAATKEGTKLTENKIEELVLTNSVYMDAQSKLFATRLNALKAEAYWRSAAIKADMIKVIGYRQSTEIKKLY